MKRRDNTRQWDQPRECIICRVVKPWEQMQIRRDSQRCVRVTNRCLACHAANTRERRAAGYRS